MSGPFPANTGKNRTQLIAGEFMPFEGLNLLPELTIRNQYPEVTQYFFEGMNTARIIRDWELAIASGQAFAAAINSGSGVRRTPFYGRMISSQTLFSTVR